MSKRLTAADLQEADLQDELYCEIEIGLSKISQYDDEEQYPGPIQKSSKKAELLDAGEIKQQFGVSDEVASKIAGYQNDIQAKFLSAIEKVIEESDRYNLVKQFLGDKAYNDSVFTEYIYQNPSLKDLDAGRYLLRNILGVTASVAILAIIVYSVKTFGILFDRLGGWILGSIWAALTLLAALSIPKNYKTRSFLIKLLKSSSPSN